MQSKFIHFYIVVHKKELIDKFEQEKKYERVGNYTYLLVGNHPVNYTSDKIIQCEHLPNNIEHRKNFLAYTGWYAVCNNTEMREEYACLLEYDTTLTDDFNLDALSKEIRSKGVDMYGIARLNINCCFLNNDVFTSGMVDFLKSEGIQGLTTNNTEWMVSNNIFIRPSTLRDLTDSDLARRCFQFMKLDNRMNGHYLERFTTVFCFLQNRRFDFAGEKMFCHPALDSHGTMHAYRTGA